MSTDHAVRVRLIALLRDSMQQPEALIGDEEPLITSGRLNSVALLDLAMWIERELGRPLEMHRLDLPEVWDSIARILRFLEMHRDQSP